MSNFFPVRTNTSLSGAHGSGNTNTKINTRGCSVCGLYKTCKSPRMDVGGKGKKNILIIAEAPGADEDKKGTQLVGEVGMYLEDHLNDFGMRLHQDFYKINSINCRPPRNRAPRPKEIIACRKRVWNVIQEKKPKAIFLMGRCALHSFLHHRWSRDNLGKMERWRGWHIPDRKTNCWVFPMYHPSFAMRNEGLLFEKLFLDDLEGAVKQYKKKLPKYTDERQYVKILTTRKANEMLEKLLDDPPEMISIDYETTGLKPHLQGHEIVYCGIATNSKCTYGFAYSKQIHKLLKQVLCSKKIKMSGHNIKFESSWSRAIFGAWPKGWVHDSMLAAHMEDNRRGATGLKFLVYTRFGEVGYDDAVGPYLKGRGNLGANNFNTIKGANPTEAKMYVALDALYTYKITKQQMGNKTNETPEERI